MWNAIKNYWSKLGIWDKALYFVVISNAICCCVTLFSSDPTVATFLMNAIPVVIGLGIMKVLTDCGEAPHFELTSEQHGVDDVSDDFIYNDHININER